MCAEELDEQDVAVKALRVERLTMLVDRREMRNHFAYANGIGACFDWPHIASSSE